MHGWAENALADSGFGSQAQLEPFWAESTFETARFSRSLTSPGACLHELTRLPQVLGVRCLCLLELIQPIGSPPSRVALSGSARKHSCREDQPAFRSSDHRSPKVADQDRPTLREVEDLDPASWVVDEGLAADRDSRLCRMRGERADRRVVYRPFRDDGIAFPDTDQPAAVTGDELATWLNMAGRCDGKGVARPLPQGAKVGGGPGRNASVGAASNDALSCPVDGDR